MGQSSTRAVVAAIACAVLALTGCSGGSGDGATTPDGSQSAAASEAPASGKASASASAKVEPAKRQEIAVDEVKEVSTKDAAYTLTITKVVVNDFYIEAEVRLVNNGTNALQAWYGSASSAPRLFDDRGREYPFQVQAGGDNKSLRLEAAEGLDASLVFAGRLGPDVKALTLDFQKIDAIYNQVEFEIPVKSS